MKYNEPFFSLFENIFKLLKEEYSEEIALNHFSKLMKKGLAASYGKDFVKEDIHSFINLVGKRDEKVGLEVEFIVLSTQEFLYRFLRDPFPGLKGEVDPAYLDKCYMDFKIEYLLGSNWAFQTTKHLWKGDQYIEHRIFKYT